MRSGGAAAAAAAAHMPILFGIVHKSNQSDKEAIETETEGNARLQTMGERKGTNKW
jgi:hypothetical protein